jgi:hypothetical protein
MTAANTALETAGHGSRNFSVAAYSGAAPSHAALHTWGDPAFETAVRAIAGVVVDDTPGDPVTRTQALIEAQGADWGEQAPMLPTSGNAVANTLYKYGDDELWWCIQTFNRTTFSAPPATYPALIRRARVPGQIAAWVQPIDQFDAYKLLNPFTGEPDKATHNGQTWRVSQADGAGNNVWPPSGAGAFGWVVA